MRNAKGDLKQVREIGCLAEFSDFATEALPYWIERAGKMERALERACKHVFCCPPEGACAAGLGVKCADCLKKYFLEEEADKNDDD